MRSPAGGASSPPVAAAGVQRGLTPVEQQRQMKLKQLQMEKEMLMKRQEELNRQVNARLGKTNDGPFYHCFQMMAKDVNYELVVWNGER